MTFREDKPTRNMVKFVSTKIIFRENYSLKGEKTTEKYWPYMLHEKNIPS